MVNSASRDVRRSPRTGGNMSPGTTAAALGLKRSACRAVPARPWLRARARVPFGT